MQSVQPKRGIRSSIVDLALLRNQNSQSAHAIPITRVANLVAFPIRVVVLGADVRLVTRLILSFSGKLGNSGLSLQMRSYAGGGDSDLWFRLC